MNGKNPTIEKKAINGSHNTSSGKLSEERMSMESKGSGENLESLSQPPNITVKKEHEVALSRTTEISPASPAQPYTPGYYMNNFQHMTPTQSRFISNGQVSPVDHQARSTTPFQLPQYPSPMLSPANIPRNYSPQRGFLPQRLYAHYAQGSPGFTSSQLQQPMMQHQLSPIPLGVVSPPIISPSINPSIRTLKPSQEARNQQNRKRATRKGSRNLYVANLPKDFSGTRLQEMFAPFGKITRSRITNNASGHLSYAFVEFQNVSDARNAILNLDNTLVDRENISVTVALQKTHSNPNLPPTNVYIRGPILKGSTMKEIHSIFGTFGKIIQARILNSKQGIVFVRFDNTHAATACINYYKTRSGDIENIGFAHRNRKQINSVDIPWTRSTIPAAPSPHDRNGSSNHNMFQVPSQEDFDIPAGSESTSTTPNYGRQGTTVRVEELNILTLLLAKYWGSFGNVLFPLLFPETRMLISNPIYFQQRTTQMYTTLKSREAKVKNTGKENEGSSKSSNPDFLPATPPTMTQSNYETRNWKELKLDNVDFEAVQKEFRPLMISTPPAECSSMNSISNRQNLASYSDAQYSNEAQLQALHLHGYNPSPIPHPQIPASQRLVAGSNLANPHLERRADVPGASTQPLRKTEYLSKPNVNEIPLRPRPNSTPDLASCGTLKLIQTEASLRASKTDPKEISTSSTSLRERREFGELKLEKPTSFRS